MNTITLSIVPTPLFTPLNIVVSQQLGEDLVRYQRSELGKSMRLQLSTCYSKYTL